MGIPGFERGSVVRRASGYVASGVGSGALGYFGQLLVEHITKQPWVLPIAVTTVLAGVAGLLAWTVWHERKKRAWIELRVAKLEQQLQVEVQQLQTYLTVNIRSEDGATAEVKKVVHFAVLAESLPIICEDVAKIGEGTPPPTFALHRRAPDGPKKDKEKENWVTCEAPPKMAPKKMPGRDQWTAKPVQPLTAGNVYKKTVTFAPRNAYPGVEEYHSHRFEREEKSFITIVFSENYGGGLVAKWRAGEDLPNAMIVHRYRHSENLTVTPVTLAGGGISFRFECEPHIGDYFRFDWKNPAGRRPATGGAP